jgi:uncharacterized protein (DUF1501 family)
MSNHPINRRTLLASSIALGATTLLVPQMALAQAATKKKLLFVLQRGAADGLATLAPIGDPDFARHRAPFVDDYADAMKVGSFFALHPALKNIGKLYTEGQAAFVHATASSYRERSHFDGQNLLESGGPKAYAAKDGWMNRMLGLLPEGQKSGLALAQIVPLALQGINSVSSYAPTRLPNASADLMDRVSRMYESDPQLEALWQKAIETRAMAGNTQMRNLRDAQEAGKLAASLMNTPDGASVMMIESDGWDSHAGQRGQLSNMFGRLDALLGSYRDNMGASWNDTLVLVATEFGRTVAVNGTNGTDHGTGSVAMALGGAVKGGQVIADWPGLKQNNLYESRDLNPTTPLESVLAGAVAGHFGLDPELAMLTLFPGRSTRPIEGLIRL